MRNNHTNVAEMQKDAVDDNVKNLIAELERGDITPNDFWVAMWSLTRRVSDTAAYIEQENRAKR
jgi:hypothetical protein